VSIPVLFAARRWRAPPEAVALTFDGRSNDVPRGLRRPPNRLAHLLTGQWVWAPVSGWRCCLPGPAEAIVADPGGA